MRAKILLDFPISSSGCGDVKFSSDGLTCLLEYEFINAQVDWIGGVQFSGVMAFRFKDEMRSADYRSEAYNSLAEILVSDWILELKRTESANLSSVDQRHHYACFLDSNGYFEIIAESFEIIPLREGHLDG